jgi:hypothetical protein
MVLGGLVPQGPQTDRTVMFQLPQAEVRQPGAPRMCVLRVCLITQLLEEEMWEKGGLNGQTKAKGEEEI